MSVNNTKYGVSSLNNNSGSNNTAIGAYTSYNNLDASNNTAVGSNSSFFNKIGSNNTAIGSGSLCNNIKGSLNTAVGSSALEGPDITEADLTIDSVGDQNVAVGAQALFSTKGTGNTAVGTYSLKNLDDASFNTAIGFSSGLNDVSGNYNTFLGANTDIDNNENTYNYSTAIGYNAKINAPNQIMMGGDIGNKIYPNVVFPGSAQFTEYTPYIYDDLSIVPKQYVDTVSQGLSPKGPVLAATTGPISGTYDDSNNIFDVSNNLIIDGVLITDGTSVLIKNQEPPTQYGNIANGIYVYNILDSGPSTSKLTRRLGLEAGDDATGAYLFVQQGTKNGGSLFIQINKNSNGNPVIVGTNRLEFVQYYEFNFKLGRGLEFYSSTDGNSYLNVDISLNFINELDSTTQLQPGEVPTGSGTLTIGKNTDQVIIGTNNPLLNPVQFTAGITGPTGSFSYISSSSGITGPTGSFTFLSSTEVATINQISAPTNDYKIDTLDRVYQELNTDPSWNAVNGYYGLAKDAYPALNPYSSGVQAVSTWTSRTSATESSWQSVCWSPELGIFVAVSYSGVLNRIMTSPDGISWTSRTTPVDNIWNSICWSPELGLFVAVAENGSNNGIMTSPDGITWTIRNSPANNQWRSVCWSAELGIFVAVATSGTGNRVMTSPDGYSWDTTSAAADNHWWSVCWSAELSLFVATATSGTGNRVMTSNDGITWKIRTSAADIGWRSVCWSPELGIFVAVAQDGSGNRVMTSPDGTTWTSRTNPVDNNWVSVCWSPELGLFVSVAFSGGGNRVMTSPDGINWTTRTSAADNQWLSVCWSPELGIFVAVSINGTAGNRVMTSSLAGRPPTSYNVFDNSFNRIDSNGNWTYGKRVYQEINADPSWNAVNGYYGLAKDAYPALNPYSSGVQAVQTWTSRTSAADIGWRSVVWAAELRLFVAVAQDGSGNRVMTSPDGINWTSRTSAADNNWTSVCWSAELGLFVAVAQDGSGNRVMTSIDGITWTSRTTPSADNTWISVVWAAELGLFVAVAYSGTSAGNDRVMTSTDGISWNIQNFGAITQWTSVCWSPELSLFVAVAEDTNDRRVMTSPDGKIWTIRYSPNNDWRSVCWSAELGLFVAVSSSGTNNRVMTSPNGINWTTRTNSVDNPWRSVCWSAELGLFVAVASSGTGVMTSPDGINWTTRTSAANISWFAVCWSPELGIFVAVATSGTGNRVMTSSLAGRPPTSYNVFDSSFNRIDSNGNWSIKGKEFKTTDSNLLVETTGGNLELKCNSTNSIVFDRSNNNITLTGTSSFNINCPTTDVSGNLHVSGEITAITCTTSDYRIKENIEPLDNTINVDNLNPVKYFNKQRQKEDMGLIAHELQEVFPFLVNGEKDGEKYQSVNYTGLTAVLIKEIQDLKQRVSQLENNSNK